MLVDLGQTDPATPARLIKGAIAGAKLVAFALDETDDQVFACAAAGFSGYVPRHGGADDCTAPWWTRWQVACTARLTSPPRCLAAFAGLSRERDPHGPLPSLSTRESEILALVEQGRSNKEIACQLAISGATVKNHMHNILQKLQVSRRGEAAARLRHHHAA